MRHITKYITASISSTVLLANVAVAECNPNIVPKINAEQYTINTDNTVTDTKTGLTWMRCPVGFAWNESSQDCVEQLNEKSSFSWQEALSFASTATDSNGTPWRLPNTKELHSLVKLSCYEPAIETSVFSTLPITTHWTSTPSLSSAGAWSVNFRSGGQIPVDKQNTYFIRLVRDNN